MEIMITPTGEPYGVTLVKNKYGSYNFLMLDAYGNIYYDPNDRSQGLYIVRHGHCSTACHSTVHCLLFLSFLSTRAHWQCSDRGISRWEGMQYEILRLVLDIHCSV